MQEIVIPHTPRPAQQEVYDLMDRYLYAVLVWHRRAGKTTGPGINYAIRRLLQAKTMMPRVGYFAPLRKQAKKIAWEYVKMYTKCFEPNRKVSESDLSITLPGNRKFLLYGADNPESILGEYFDYVVLDEYGNMKDKIWTESIFPMILERDGGALFMGTPKGRNQFYQKFKFAEESMDSGSMVWLAHMLKASESGLLRPDQLAQARTVMTPEEYDQEFECSFVAAIIGTYYSHLLAQAENEGRILPLTFDPTQPVYTASDIGIGEGMVTYYAQESHDGYFHILGAEHCPQNEGLEYACAQMMTKGYTYAEHYFPWDIHEPNTTTGKSREAVVQRLLGSDKVIVLPKTSVDDGIHVAKNFIGRCRFNRPNLKEALDSLNHFRREWMEKNGIWSPKPFRDWTSHYAAAWRYMAIGIRKYRKFGQVHAYSNWDTLGFGDGVDKLEACDSNWDELLQDY